MGESRHVHRRDSGWSWPHKPLAWKPGVPYHSPFRVARLPLPARVVPSAVSIPHLLRFKDART
jgi:hypothetical protein